MPSLNIDELAKKLFEPITITLDGKEYVITTLPSEALDGMSPDSRDVNAVRKFLATTLGVNEKDLKKTDYRKLIAAGLFIMSEAKKQIQSYTKNVPGESVNQSQ